MKVRYREFAGNWMNFWPDNHILFYSPVLVAMNLVSCFLRREEATEQWRVLRSTSRRQKTSASANATSLFAVQHECVRERVAYFGGGL